ncbi:MAG: pyridoxamine 5'-phosphate oxidase [Alphaproteobacteria bacterium]|nr:pyridoxamine 5'-phosphate oxidase [Alphaproteobacteria bacterium]
MTKTERVRFLKEPRVGVLAVAAAGQGPLAVPVWYRMETNGDLVLVTPKASLKARLIRKAKRLSLCVQDEKPPYRYVSVEGPVVAAVDADVERDLRPIARRYYGLKKGDAYADQLAPEFAGGTRVKLTFRPERWLTVDYGKRRG